MFDTESLLADFPILDQSVNGRRLVYLDNAATTQKPLSVLQTSRHYYEAINSNIHRGTHQLARAATETFEKARETVAAHLKAASGDEVIFTAGTTAGINLVAAILGLSCRIGPGDEVLISTLEHHSNIVPWQMLCQRTGAMLKVIPCHEDGTLDRDAFNKTLAGGRVKILALTWISNAFGTVNPVAEMTKAAKDAGAMVLIDAAQAIAHQAVDVQALGADFLAFSGHKIYAPTGIGVLWGRAELLNELPPWQGGGEMIKEVTFAHTTYNDPPFKYEAGTPNIEGAIALAAAFDYVNEIGMETIHAHEAGLIRAAAEAIADIPGIRIYGPPDRSGSLSFNIEGLHHYDVGTLIDQMGVAVRTGHHCCQPLMARFGITGTVRASFALYNTEQDVEALAETVSKAVLHAPLETAPFFMKIVLGISGSIAAYKAADLASQLVKQGHDVHAVMTRAATEFITPLTLQTITRNPVLVSLEDEKQAWKPGHIDLADTADLFLAAPATANLLGEFANGLAPDPLTSVYLALPRSTPVLIAPAMNGKMWLHPANQRNVEYLKADGCAFVGPAEGELACGYEGVGRLAEVADILAVVAAMGKQ